MSHQRRRIQAGPIVEEDDPYAFILEAAHISLSQEEILRNAPFVEFSSANSHIPNPPHSHTPNDTVSQPPTSRALPEDSDDHHHGSTTTNAAGDLSPAKDAVGVNADDLEFDDFCGSSDRYEFVDVESDSELGLAEALLAQEIDVPECSHGDGVGKIPNGQVDESHFGEEFGV